MSTPSRALALHFAPPSAFASDINLRVRAALRNDARCRFATASQWWSAALVLALSATAYAALLSRVISPFVASWCVVAVGFGIFMTIAQVGHDAAHGVLSSKPWLNRLVVFVVFALAGIDGALWRDRHIRLHHQFVNLPGTGIDADSVKLLRLAPDKPWRWWHRFQPFYAPLFYMCGHMGLAWIEDFASLHAARKTGRRNFMRWRAIVIFAAGKIIHAVLFLLLPLWLLRPSLLTLGLSYALASGVFAICFVILVVGTHVSDLAAFPLPDCDGRIPHDWATHQVMTAVDWAPTRPVAAMLCGGANAHLAHHLFPGFAHCHLAWLSQIIVVAVVDHRLQHRVTSFAGMILAQWRHLVVLSRPPVDKAGKELDFIF